MYENEDVVVSGNSGVEGEKEGKGRKELYDENSAHILILRKIVPPLAANGFIGTCTTCHC